MGVLETLTLALGASWGAGLNLYATAAIMGVLDLMGLVDLPEPLQILGNPLVIGVAAILYFIEFFADKIPGLDSVWDAIHTFVRIPAGALMAMGAIEGLDIGFAPELQTVAALVGGGAIAAGTHATKAGTRAVINTSPEPVTNWTASFLEDVLVVVGMFFAIFKPIVFLVIFAVFALLAIWIVPKIWRGIRKVFSSARHPVNTIKSDPQERMSLSLAQVESTEPVKLEDKSG
jgi:hypothetical protein